MEEVFSKRRQWTLKHLEEGNWNIFISVFGESDRLQHMFWRYTDENSPLYTEEGAEQYGNVIEEWYIRYDSLIGEVMERIDDRTVLIVMSDHGFHPFNKAVNVNTWLLENGFLVLKGETRSDYKLKDLFEGGVFWPNVDWSKTKAYAISLGEIRINLKGREASGIVAPGQEYEQVRDEIIEKFEQLHDPDTNAPVVRKVYRKEEIYSGPFMEKAPDLIFGLYPGYRESWQSALGGIPVEVIEPNLKKWSADHVTFDPSLIKGMLLSNREITAEEPDILDFAPTIFEYFGFAPLQEFDGKSWGIE